jgi:hypothetical protein
MMQTPRDDELVPLRRAALCLGVGQRLVYEARDRNELPVYRFNSRWCWVRWADAVAWLERHRRRAPEVGAAPRRDIMSPPVSHADFEHVAALNVPDDKRRS